MKKILSFIAIAIIGLTSVVAQQTVTLTFTGRGQNNAYVRLDHVTIENLTRNWSETIWFPDTVYTLTVGTGVEEHLLNGGMQVMPNPFNGKTQVNVHSVKDEKAVITVVDINGRKCAEYDGIMSEGDNYFEIQLTTPQTYILSVQTTEGKQRVKMVNTGRGVANRIGSLGSGAHPATVNLKSTTSHEFELGDEMHYQGYSLYFDSLLASISVIQNQTMNEELTLLFDIPNLTNLNSCEVTLMKQNETGFGNRITQIQDHQGNSYQVVQIGNQCWMKENMRATTSPSTGTYLIPTADTTYIYTFTGKQARWCNNDSSSYALYGLLYNWNAAVDTFNTAYGETSENHNFNNEVSLTFNGHRRGICPEGWHLPIDAEWTALTNYVSSQSEYVCGDSASYIAKALASEIGWNNYSCGECDPGDQSQHTNNSTGFSAVPAGYCFDGVFLYFYHRVAVFWSSLSYNGFNPFIRSLSNNSADVYRSGYRKTFCLSVRCLRDETTVATTEASNVSGTSTTLNGCIANPYNVTITAQGFEWKVTNGGSYTQVTANGIAMTYDLTGLTANTCYTYRAFVTYGGTTVYGEEVMFTTLSVSSPFDGQPCLDNPTVIDYDSNIYNTVQIGTQCWMKENLRTIHYSDGTSISLGSDTSSTIGYRYNYSWSAIPFEQRGFLYNWKAVMRNSSSSLANPNNVQGICPTGWHVPSDAEWTQLTDYVSAQSDYWYENNSSYIAKSLAANTGWDSIGTLGTNQNSNNATGFSALPAGHYFIGYYSGSGLSAYFWSTTEASAGYAWNRYLGLYSASVGRNSENKNFGYSVRCLHD